MSIRLEKQGRLARIIFAKPPLNILDLDDLGQLELLDLNRTFLPKRSHGEGVMWINSIRNGIWPKA